MANEVYLGFCYCGFFSGWLGVCVCFDESVTLFDGNSDDH